MMMNAAKLLLALAVGWWAAVWWHGLDADHVVIAKSARPPLSSFFNGGM